MKLNAATEMMPISFAGFSKLHPYCPKDQAKGYEEIISRLGKYLCHITSFDAVSFQPNSGAQGELAGLLTVKRYYEDKGDFKRNIALIPQSAHGTNPASAALAGLKIIPVNCLADGRIDVTDFNSKCDRYATEIAVFMVTYPSTYGVFENTIVQLCEKIHEIGAQVYMDGANLNAQVGLTDPNTIGADLCHINLHKTFAIPHGGGGPGMGPICVKKHLSDFLPQFSLSLEDSVFSVSAAEFSSASILLISYAYIELLGSVGLKNCTEIAILNANYIRKRLETYYPILFTGEKGNVAHELIIDCRPFKKSAGIEVEDIAKRLMDYSFHAPTLSWPVPGTLMIEPTESESKSELDRFCDALIQIYHEMTAIAENRADKDDNMLKNAPHPLYHLLSDEWNHAYTREQAAYPLESLKNQKFWPSVARLNQAQGDRQLICTCDSDVLTENLTIE
jgi:glycine dehydrogenase